MPISNSPDIRIKKYDELFKGTFERSSLPPNSYIFNDYNIDGIWTKEELAEVISDILEMDRVISTRTVSNDLKKLDKEYKAPIESKKMKVVNKDGKEVNNMVFFYWDKEKGVFNNNNLSADDLEKLRSVTSILEQFKGFTYFEDVSNLIDRLENKISKIETPEIFFETVDDLVGIDKIDDIARAIKGKKVLKIEYKVFGETDNMILTVHPYQLREYNNRWFLLAYTEEFKERKIGTYGLDRIQKIEIIHNKKIRLTDKKITASYFKDIIGVTNYLDKEVEEIIFEVKKPRSNYVITKPWHTSQKIKRETDNSVVFSINVKQNKELESLILSFGSDIVVKAPKSLMDKISNKLIDTIKLYQ